MNTEIQNQKVLRHLQSGQHLTSLEALHRYGIFRLAARIYDLKQSGHNISKVWVQPSDTRPDTRVASYYLC